MARNSLSPIIPNGMKRPRFPRITVLFAGLMLALGVAGISACSELDFYWQAGLGQMEIINKRRPIEDVLKDDAVAGKTKAKLRIILRAQDFATRRLALPKAGHYRYFTDLGRKYVSWLVVAAQPLSMSEHKFCYLIMGCMGYRGYFKKADADALAEQLRGEKLDVQVRPVRAYSTLGWFDDPVLNTFLNGQEMELAGTLIHEQTHRLFFLKGDTAFNESFASFVEEEGLRRYAAEFFTDGGALLARYEKVRADRRRFREIVLRGRARLVRLYQSALGDAEKLRRKARLFEAMREDYRNQKESFKILNYEGWFNKPLNNAHVTGFAQYSLHVKAFQALFEQNGGDFQRFYDAVKALAELEPPERRAGLKKLEN